CLKPASGLYPATRLLGDPDVEDLWERGLPRRTEQREGSTGRKEDASQDGSQAHQRQLCARLRSAGLWELRRSVGPKQEVGTRRKTDGLTALIVVPFRPPPAHKLEPGEG